LAASAAAGDLLPTEAISDALADVPNAPHDDELSPFAEAVLDAPHAPSVWLRKSAFKAVGEKRCRKRSSRPL